MNIDHLKMFLQVVQYGIFEQAAQKNFLSQRAVSKKITQLENELGTYLFDRGTNKITLTPQGKVFLPSAQDIVNNLNDAISDLKSFNTKNNKSIRVGYFSPFEGQLAQESLYRLSEIEPNLDITIREQSNEHLIQSILNDSLDIGFSINYGKDCINNTSDLTSLKVFHEQMVMGISKQNIQSQNEYLSLEMLPDLPIIYFSLENSTFLLDSFIASLSSMQNIKNICRTTSVEHMHMLVSLNKAIAFYPKGLISQQEMDNDKYIEYIPFDDLSKQVYDIVALFKSDNKNKMLKKLIGIVKGE